MVSPPTDCILVSPAGILTAWPATTCLSRTSIRASVSPRSPAKDSGSTFANAEFVGANTVKGASSPVPLGKAVPRAVRRVEKRSSVARSSPVVGSFSEPGLMEGMKFLLPPAAGMGLGLFPVIVDGVGFICEGMPGWIGDL